MGEMSYKPGMVKPEEAFPDLSWKRKAGDEIARSIIKGVSGHVEIERFAVKPRPPWETRTFREHHFEYVNRDEYGWLLPRAFLEDIDPELMEVYIVARKPLILMVTLQTKKPLPWDEGWSVPQKPIFYRLVWRIWWRRVDPMKDAKLREVLEAAVALDALAGRDP